VVPWWVSLGTYPGIHHLVYMPPNHTSGCTRVVSMPPYHTSGCTMVGIHLPTTLCTPWWVYTSLPLYVHPYHPGYTPPSCYCLVYRSSCLVRCLVRDDGVLGSNLEIVRDMRRREPSILPRV